MGPCLPRAAQYVVKRGRIKRQESTLSPQALTARGERTSGGEFGIALSLASETI